MITDLTIFSAATIHSGSTTISPVQVDLYTAASDAQVITLNLKATSGLGVNPGASALLTVYYAFSNTDHDVGVVDVTKILQSDYFTWRWNNSLGGAREYNTARIPINAQYLYVWGNTTSILADTELIIGGKAINPVTRTVSAVATNAKISRAGLALAANANRVGFNIQNVGTNEIFVNLSLTPAIAATCSFILAGAADLDSGRGGSYQSTNYTGPVTIGGTGPQLLVTEY